MSNELNADDYPDKALVSYVKNPEILNRFFKNQPEELDEIINHFSDVLGNTTKKEDRITAELHIEERSRSHDPVDFECSPKWTVLSTKIKICDKYQTYNINNLYILYKRSIAKDWIYLKDCGIEADNDVLYVYIYVPQPQIAIAVTKALSNKDKKDLTLSEMEFHVDQTTMNMPNFDATLPDFNSILPENIQFTNSFLSLPNGPDSSMGKLWTCNVCTFLNEDWRNDCCMCNAIKPADVKEGPVVLPGEINNSEMGNSLEDAVVQPGWKCLKCTFLNEPTRPGCQMCSDQRPLNYEVPENYVPSEEESERIGKEKQVQKAAEEQYSLERRENYHQHMAADEHAIIQSVESLECAICYIDADPTNTIVLRECLHRFCKDCIAEHVKTSEEAVVTCPYMDDDYKCNNAITHREIQALLNEEDFQKYLRRGLMQAEKESQNSFHCKSPDCPGWCVYEDIVNTFICPACTKKNCLTCKAIHDNKNCKEYQDELMQNAATDEEAKKTKILLDKMVKSGEAMHCPQCNIIIQKKVGCDWIRCPMCRLEICWVTKGPRWGPGGKGDITGGCQCGVQKKCHKNCNNCH